MTNQLPPHRPTTELQRGLSGIGAGWPRNSKTPLWFGFVAAVVGFVVLLILSALLYAVILATKV
ncbi:hypothetical protein [Yinghuangia sp. YIM S09857]|uniref:hypothetical protein n=1 Tax=Yinghuangia sp. YIM S09857 TaxID=3436929 RepID=UPI003F536E91